VSDVADLSPEYCVGSIIPDLLQSESHEAQLIALKTLHLVATSVPSGSPLALQQRASTPRRSMALTTGQGSCIKRMVQVRIVQADIRGPAMWPHPCRARHQAMTLLLLGCIMRRHSSFKCCGHIAFMLDCVHPVAACQLILQRAGIVCVRQTSMIISGGVS
jgi:hypothetical protein